VNATEIFSCIAREERDAHQKYGPFASAHEGYGVLVEEVAELLDAIRNNHQESAQWEACQVSAVAWRLAKCLTDGHEDTLKRSGMR
jgi:NTP pyrophosphatase (non-canonical NTP hydrolase)